MSLSRSWPGRLHRVVGQHGILKRPWLYDLFLSAGEVRGSEDDDNKNGPDHDHRTENRGNDSRLAFCASSRVVEETVPHGDDQDAAGSGVIQPRKGDRPGE